MIRIENLNKKYGERNVLQRIDLEIRRGEIFGIVGESGAGKSTLLRCMNGLETYDGGTLYVDGTDITKLTEREMLDFRKSIGMIFQNFALLERKTVFENVTLPMECWKYEKGAMRKRALELLELVGLEGRENAVPSELSGGQKQRVAIARALTLSPQILLCDEATSALDPSITKSILQLLMKINREMGITVVVVTHEMAVVRELCDRMAIMSEGIIVEKGSVERIFLDEPPALLELVGGRSVVPPQGQTILRLSIRDADLESPILYEAARENLWYSIVASNIDQYKDKRMGHIYLRVEEGDADRFIRHCEKYATCCSRVNTSAIERGAESGVEHDVKHGGPLIAAGKESGQRGGGYAF